MLQYFQTHSSLVQFYMPPEPVVNKDFLKEVIQGEKHLLLKREVKYIQVPHWEEVSVKRMYPLMKKDA